MKLVFAIILVTTLYVFSAEQRLEEDARNRIVKIAQQIEFVDEHRFELQELQALVDKSTKLSDRQKKRYDELEKARSLAEESVVELLSLVKAGTFVLDYPGLLTLGKIRYQASSYCMTVDAGLKYGEPAPILIIFDNAGKIIKVSRLMVKR